MGQGRRGKKLDGELKEGLHIINMKIPHVGVLIIRNEKFVIPIQQTQLNRKDNGEGEMKLVKSINKLH